MPDGRITKNVVGPIIAKIRSSKDWSQETLATKCQLRGWDISRGVIAGIEGKHRSVEDWELFILSKVLEVPMESLMPEENRMLDNLPKPSENALIKRRAVLEKVRIRRLRNKYQKTSDELQEKYGNFTTGNDTNSSNAKQILADIGRMQKLLGELAKMEQAEISEDE